MDAYQTAISVGDIMGMHYGRPAKIITGIFSVIVCAGILGAQVGAIGYIFHVFLDVPQIYGILIGCGIVIVYSTVGGMRSVVFTDVVQFILLSIGIPITLLVGLHKVGGISAVKAAVPLGHFTFLGGYKTFLTFVSLFLTFLLGETLVPPYVQRLFLAKNTRHIQNGTLWSGLFSIPFFAMTGGIGLIALTLKPDLDPNLSMPFVIKEVLPVGLCGVVIAGVISIVMSSADSFLNAASVSFTNDVVSPLAKTRINTRHELFAVRFINLFVGILSVIFAIKIKSILDILVYSYNFWSPIVLVPLVAAIMGIKATRKSFFLGSLAGVLGVIVWKLVLHNPWGINGLIIGVAGNGFAFFLTHTLQKRQTAT
jgi:SSS family solute:Na+ symporter